MRKQRTQYVIMGFGFGGNHGDGFDANGHVFSSSWYLRPEQLQQYISNGHYPADQMEGCILIDKRAVLQERPGLSIDAPMVNLKLADADVSRAADRLDHPAARLVMSAIAENQPGIGVLAAKALIDPTYIGLDYVSPAAYVAWWRAHGATIGRVEHGMVIWEAANPASLTTAAMTDSQARLL